MRYIQVKHGRKKEDRKKEFENLTMRDMYGNTLYM